MYLRQDRAMIAVMIIVDVAFYAGCSRVISSSDIATRTEQTQRGIEPLLQILTRAGLLESTRGPRGGYRLARAPRLITLDDVARAVAPSNVEAKTANLTLANAVIIPYWESMDSIVATHMKQTTLADMLLRAEKGGLKRPQSEPISFSI